MISHLPACQMSLSTTTMLSYKVFVCRLLDPRQCSQSKVGSCLAAPLQEVEEGIFQQTLTFVPTIQVWSTHVPFALAEILVLDKICISLGPNGQECQCHKIVNFYKFTCCQDDGKDLVCEFLVAGQVPTGSAVDKVANHRYKI